MIKLEITADSMDDMLQQLSGLTSAPAFAGLGVESGQSDDTSGIAADTAPKTKPSRGKKTTPKKAEAKTETKDDEAPAEQEGKVVEFAKAAEAAVDAEDAKAADDGKPTDDEAQDTPVDPPADAKTYSKDQVTQLALKYVCAVAQDQDGRRNAMKKDVLDPFKIASLTDLPEAQYGEMVDHLKTNISGLEGGEVILLEVGIE